MTRDRRSRQRLLSLWWSLAALCTAAILWTAPGATATASDSPVSGSGVPQAADVARYDQAVAALRELVEKDRTNTRNQVRLAEAESKAADAHVALARAYRDQGRLADARRELTVALSQVPAHPVAVTMASTIDGQLRQSEDLARQAQAALDRGDLAAAVQLAERALAADPSQAAAGRVLQTARRSSLVDEYERRALAGEWELAWPAAVQAVAIAPDDSVAMQNLARAEDMIRQRIGYGLRVVPLPSQSVEAGVVLAAAGALSDALDRCKARHVRLVPMETAPESLRQTTLALSEVGDPARLKAAAERLGGADLCVFVDVAARRVAAPPARGTATSSGSIKEVFEQASAEFQVARDALARARQVALADAARWDPEARRALGTEETFLAAAARGVYGPAARQAAQDYQAARLKLEQAPQRAAMNGRAVPGTSPGRPQLAVQVRLRLVEVATGRILLSDDELEERAEAPVASASAPGSPQPAQRPERNLELQTQAVRRMTPALAGKARDILLRRSLVLFEDAQKVKGDGAVRDFARFLFDCPADPGPHRVALALDEIFSPRVTGAPREACRQLAAQRLGLTVGPSLASGPSPTPAPAPPPAPAARTVQAPGPPTPVASISASPASPPKPGLTVFEDAVSRDDARYPKERPTLDGIRIKVLDTDADPLDTDIEVMVGAYRGKFKALRVGARLRIRGQSGRDYRLTLVSIDDRYETVHFRLELLSGSPGR